MPRQYFSPQLLNRTSAPLTALLLASTALVGFTSARAQELPTGGSVASGGVTISNPSAAQLNIKQSTSSAIVNWQSFSIGSGATVNIDQPTSTSTMLNRVTGGTKSTIAGQLNANGQVFLVNPNGIAISKTGKVSAAGFVGSSLDISDDDFKAGKLKFQGQGASAAVSNEGAISIGRGGYAALIGGSVDNAGTISVPLGKVGLGSGEKATLDLSGDGFLQVSVPTQAGGGSALVSNSGTISADGGTVELKAAAVRDAARQAVNMSGVIEARTVSGQSGAIVLGGGDGSVEVSGRLDASAPSSGTGGKIAVTGRKLKLKGATVDASGKNGGGTIKIGGDKQGSGTLQRAATTEVDAATTINASATGNGNGGTVIVWSDEVTGFQGTILARGGDSGGDGGFSEVSSHDVLDFDGNVDLSARFGDTGYLLLDPYNLTIATTGTPTVSGSGPNFSPTQNSSVLRVTTLQNALANANVMVTTGASGSQAGDITVANAVTWSSGNSLTLSAYRNIAVNANLTSTGGGAINLRADSSGTGTGTVSFASSTVKASTSGVVSIYYNPTVNPAGSGVNSTSYANPIENYSGNIAGGGTLNAAMLVNTLNDLRNIKNNDGGNYALGRNIDASGTPLASAAVGTLSGTFDGLGNTISNLTITSPDASVGLFGDIGSGAIVRNLNLANVAITGTPGGPGSAAIGGLAGTNAGTISAVTVSGTVKTTADYYRSVGGLIGFSNGTIGGAISTASVQATNSDQAGGLVGALFAGTITASSASGTVTVGGQSSGGGLVGDASFGSSITASFSTGSVTAGSPSKAGGLVGNLDTSSITTSYASGVVTAGGGSQTGGLVGSTNGAASISTSYATGAVNGTSYVGGLVGATLSASTTITNSYATGALTGGTPGGIVGYNSGTITSSYFDLDTTGASAAAGWGPNTATGGTGLHTSDFMTASSFTGWSFGTTGGGPGWVIVDVDSSLNNAGGAAGGTRPMLLSEYSTTITNAHQLQLMALNLNGKYTLGNNIDASTTAGGQGVWGASGFVPIGSAIATSSDIPSNANLPMGTSNERAFTGTLDGKGFSVSNLYINRPTTDFVGLIGFANAATIQNITLTGGSVTGRDHVGALLGGNRGFDSNYNFIPIYLTNLSASTAVSGRDFVGGLAGSIEAGYVTSVSATGAVSGRDYVGGLGGYMSSNSGYVQNGSTSIAASATGAVSGRNNVGGLFGYFYSSFYGTSFATGAVTATGNNVGGLMGQAIGLVGSNNTDMIYATGAVTGNNYVGGLIGLSTFTVTHAYATGAVTGNTIVGGLVGSNDSGALIDMSFATGIVRGVDQVGGLAGLNLSVIGPINGTGGAYATGAVYGTSNVGGLVGLNGSVNMGSYTLNGRIQNSYSIGAVYGTTNVGGLVGYNANDTSGSNLPATVKASYWDTETAGASLQGIGGGITTGANASATGRTTAQLMAALQTGFSTSAWGIVANTSLPYFKWLYPTAPQVVTGTAYSDRGTTPLAGVATNLLVNGTITPASAVGSTGANGYYYFLLPNGTISAGGSQVLVTSSGASAGATFQQNATGSLNGLSIYGGYLKQQGAASTLSALNAARATAVGANAAASTLIGGLANMEIDPSGTTFSIDQAISVPGTLVFSSTGTVNQTASIGANSLLLLGSGGNYALSNGGNAIGTVAASTGIVSLADSSDLTVGTVAGTSGVTATGAVTLQTAGKLTIASAAKVTAGANNNAVLAAGGAFINNRGSDAVSVSGTGRWLVYAAGPTGNTFGNLDSGHTAIWNTTAGGTVSATGNRYVFAFQPTLTFASENASMVYGDAMPTLTYSVSGYQTGVANAYLGDSATTAFTGAPALYTPSTLVLQPLGAGTYAITIDSASVAAQNGYALAFNSTGLISVAKRMVTVTANSGQGKTYGDADPSSLGYTYSDLGSGVALFGSLDRDAGENVGSYAIGQGSLTNASNANYDISFVGADFDIGKRAITVTADAKSRIYGDANPALTYQVTSGNLVNSDSLTGVLATSATTASDVGTYGITQGTLANSNYAITYAGADLSVTQRAITVTADAKSRIYGDANPALTYQVTSGNLVNDDTFGGALATSATTASSVGTYGITQGTLGNANYAITYAGADLSVTQRAITVTADAKSRIYGDANPALTYQVTSGNLVNDDTLGGALATSATTVSGVRTYGITQGTLGNANYAITYAGADLSVTQRAITVTADAKSRIYGDANPVLTYQVTSGNLVNSDSLTGALATSATTASGVGTYGITQGTLANGNYAITYAGADLSVTQRAITVTADAQSRIYGDANPALTYQVTSGNLVNDDSLTGALATSATTASGVGTYGITQGTLDNANYAITYAGADLSVMQRAITVTADAKSRIYGDANPALTYQVTSGNLVNSDSLTGALATSATTASGVGSYGIIQGTLGNANYAITYAGADLSVTQRAITVTADAKSRIYGDANPALTYQVTSGNLVNSDSLTGALATSATATSDVGSYGITQGTLANANYAITYAGADLTIGKRSVTVTVDAGQGKTYGNADPASYGYITSSLGSGADLVGALDRAAGEDTGSYAIGRGTLTDAANTNYDITYVGDNFVIGKRSVTVTAAAGQSKIYGNADPSSYGYTYSDLGTGAALFGALDRAAGENAGSYAIGQGTLNNANNSNYDITFVGADFTIGRRAITVTADAQSRAQGMPNPPLTYTIGGLGLVGTDTLTGALSTDATTASIPGSYAIEQGSLAVSANYELTYVGAELVVQPANVVPAADTASVVAYSAASHGAGRPAPVFFTGQPASGDAQTLLEDPRLDGPAFCQSLAETAAVCAASIQ